MRKKTTAQLPFKNRASSATCTAIVHDCSLENLACYCVEVHSSTTAYLNVTFRYNTIRAGRQSWAKWRLGSQYLYISIPAV